MKRDYFAQLAKEKGYPARSVFKLQEIQKRFRIIKPGFRILEIGASPGSWSQYCLELLAGKGEMVGVDPVKQQFKPDPGQNYRFIQGNIFAPDIEKICIELGPYDLILSDAAPATSGNRIVDTSRSLEIGYKVSRLASRSLKQGGGLVVKIFQGGEEGELLKSLGSLFEKVRAFKPKASKKGSKEIFFLGFSYK